jgi:hypothetical protein
VHRVEIRNAYKTLVGKPKLKRLLRTPSSRREDNIKWIIGMSVWTGLRWLIIGVGGRLL